MSINFSTAHSRFGALTAKQISGFVVLVGLLVCWNPSASAQLTEQDRKVLEWYDGLELETFAMLELVEVKTGWWSQIGNEGRKNKLIYGFLIQTSGKEFKVLTPGLQTFEFEKTAEGTPDHKIVDYKEIGLAEFAKQEAVREVDRFERGFDGKKASRALELMVLARACVSHSLDQVAHDLLVESEKQINRSRDVNDPPKTFQTKLGEDLAHYRIWLTLLKIDNPKISWEEINQDFTWIHTNFPGTRHAQRCRDSAKTLVSMIAENKAHKTPEDLEKLPKKQRVAELIFQLQSQDGAQDSQPGQCDIFYADRKRQRKAEVEGKPANPPSPGLQLFELGYAAVPQLIESLDDRRFTRSVGYHRNFYFSHAALRVGDCCKIILQRIANRRFSDRERSVKQQALAWWTEIESKGEKTFLIEATEAGDSNSAYQAHLLLKKYPDVAMSSIIKGAKKTKSQYVRSQMVTLAGEFIDKDQAREFVLGELKTADGIFVKFAAGEVLLKTKQRQLVVDYFVKNWRSLLEKNWIEPAPSGVMVMSPEHMIQFVAGMNAPAAISSLRDAYPKMKARVRMAMVTAFHVNQQGGCYTGGGIVSSPKVTFSEESENQIRALLLLALEDQHRYFEASGHWGEMAYQSPRMCDIAGHVLASRYADKYEFDFDGSRAKRNQQLIKILNQWRSAEGIDLLPLPKPRAVVESDSANQITSVEVSGNSAPLNEQWKQRVKSMNQSVLTADEIVKLLIAMADQQPDGVSGIFIECERYKPKEGFHVQIELTTEFSARGGSQQMWNGLGVGTVNGKNAAAARTGGFDRRQNPTAIFAHQRRIKHAAMMIVSAIWTIVSDFTMI